MRSFYVTQLRRLVRNNQILKTFIDRFILLKTAMRQTPVTPSIRSISSSYILHNCIKRLNPDTIGCYTTNQTSTHDVSFNKIMTLLKTNHFDEIITTLRHPNTSLDHSQLSIIISKLSNLNKCNQILSIFAIYKQEIIQDIHLLELMLKAAYKQDNYSLFEDLFNYYIQFPNLSAKTFNLALRLFLKTNTEFAKQILYQMIFSQYPIDNHTLLDFFTVADKVSTFQTIKFAVELIKRSPDVPVIPAAYGRLTRSYLRDGTGHDVNMLFEFLKERNVYELHEVKIAFFLNGIKNKSLNEIWTEFAELRESILHNHKLLSRLYNDLYYAVQLRLTSKDLQKLVNYLKQDNLLLTSASQQHIIYQLKDDSHLLEHINDLRKQGMNIDKHIIRTVWSCMLKNNPDQGVIITNIFHNLSIQNINKFPWSDELPKMFKMWTGNRSKDKAYSPYTFSNIDYWIYDQISLFINRKEDHNMMKLLNDLLRQGKKPSMLILKHMLKGLISLKSSEDHKVYQLIYELYGNPPTSVDLIWLSKIIRDMKSKDRAGLILGNDLLDFELKHHGNLSFKDFLHLSSLAIQAHRYDLSIDYLSKARNLIPNEEIAERRNLYLLFLKTSNLKMDTESFISMMKLMILEDGVYPTSYTLRRTKDYKKSLMKKMNLEKKVKEEFSEQFDKLYPELRKKFINRKINHQLNLEKIIIALEEWMNETLERK